MCDGPSYRSIVTNSWRARRGGEEGQISRGVHAIPADVSADCRRGSETTKARTRYCGPCITTDDIKSPLPPGQLSTAALHHGAINPRETYDIIAHSHIRTRSRPAPRHLCPPPPLYADPGRRMFSSTSLSNQ